MMSIFICEDDRTIRKHIENSVVKALNKVNANMQLTCSTAYPQMLIQAIDENTRGIYFLDIDLNDSVYNGFQLAEAIRKKDPQGFIIFVTVHGELTFETFRLHLKAIDYIVKNENNIEERILACLLHINKKMMNEKQEYNNEKLLLLSSMQECISLNDILYLEQQKKRRVVIHTNHEIIEVSSTLKELFKQLDDRFHQMNAKIIINTKNIKSMYLSNDKIEFITGELLGVSHKFFSIIKAD